MDNNTKNINTLLKKGKTLKNNLEKRLKGYKTDNKFKKITMDQLKMVNSQIKSLENSLLKKAPSKKTVKKTVTKTVIKPAKNSKYGLNIRLIVNDTLKKLVKHPENRAKLGFK